MHVMYICIAKAEVPISLSVDFEFPKEKGASSEGKGVSSKGKGGSSEGKRGSSEGKRGN